MATIKLHETVARSLVDSGVERLFGLMGDANLTYIAAYLDLDSGRYIGAVHESGAVSMADGYARMSDKLGVATITHGPGTTNALTALTEAVRTRTPLLLLTGETPRVRGHLQALDLRAAAQLTGADYHLVHSARTAVDDIAIAMRTIYATRRPGVLNVPPELLDEPVEYRPSVFRSPGFGRQAAGPDEDVLDAAVGVIASAERPIILAGRGVVQSGARDDVLALSEQLDAPLATTVMAKDLFRGHPLDLGLFGVEAHPLALTYLSRADCVIVLGAGLNRYTTVGGDLLRDKAVVHCDTDVSVLGGHPGSTVSVLADARTFARAVRRCLTELGPPPARRWTGSVRAELAGFTPETQFRDRSSATLIDMRTAMVALDQVLPAERTLVTDIGRFRGAPWRFLHCRPGGFSHSASFGSIGLGLATAIGASVADPDHVTVAAVGDGGLMMGLMELNTAVQERLPLVVAVLNDGSYGAEFRRLTAHGHDPSYSLRPWPSFAAVAKALGARSATIRTVDDIRELKSTFENLRTPFLLDIKADPALSAGDWE
ncbi:thiamine pyrophosphate-binding protein [Phytohabitans sp. ZYX-F-186]|uniref:Thiamine pyrophosphate-binding protein n=1 Tax=Phytohabitans maris TaxID=3071409 RepID=A0ABU0ZMC1_9ACTN|nr:thiamine pyrophosphate-binding protein [Phytohabitans sp. ZYX-F-186]MDQ7907562.1 thiamine pyrophosphate-binding protein [Phytohabitans sp. ZYX-F-186]